MSVQAFPGTCRVCGQEAVQVRDGESVERTYHPWSARGCPTNVAANSWDIPDEDFIAAIRSLSTTTIPISESSGSDSENTMKEESDG